MLFREPPSEVAMAVLSSTTKAKAGVKAAKAAAKNPALIRTGAKVSSPGRGLALKAGKLVAKRRARQQAKRIGETARTVGETARGVGEIVAAYGVPAAYLLGLIEQPTPKRTAPRVAAGVVIGASAVYFLEPEHGREHREKVAELVT